MSDCNRGVLAAFAGLAALLTAFGSGLYLDELLETESQSKTTLGVNENYRQSSTANVDGNASTPEGDFRPIAKNKADYASEDLKAQRTMAWWTQVMGFAAAFGIFLGSLSIWLIFTTFRETRKAADAAILAQRPWLDLDVSLEGISPAYRREGYYLNVALKLINLGNAPANDVQHDIAFTFYSAIEFTDDLIDIRPRDKVLSMSTNSVLANVRSGKQEGPTVFPNSEYTIYDSPKALWNFDKGKPSDFGWLTVGVKYYFAGGCGETVKVFCVRSLGFPNDSGFDYIGEDGLGYSDLDAIIRPWDAYGKAT